MKSVIKLGVLAGLFFGVGFWFAKLDTPKLAAKEHGQDGDADDLAKKQAEYEKMQQRLKLSYYKELTADPRTSSFDADASIAPAPTAPPVPVATPAAAEKEEPVPEPKAPEVEEKKPSSDRLAKALEKVLGKETPDLVASAAKVKLPTGTGSPFAVQVASLPDRKAAEELVNRLSLKGYAARLVQADLAGRGVVYRVRIHGYQNRQEAEVARGQIASQEKLEAITVAQ